MRTVAIIGGFPDSTTRNDIVKFIRDMISENPDLPPVENYWSPYARTSWGKMKFATPDDLRDFASQVRGLQLKFPRSEKNIWVTVEKTLSERRALTLRYRECTT